MRKPVMVSDVQCPKCRAASGYMCYMKTATGLQFATLCKERFAAYYEQRKT